MDVPCQTRSWTEAPISPPVEQGAVRPRAGRWARRCSGSSWSPSTPSWSTWRCRRSATTWVAGSDRSAVGGRRLHVDVRRAAAVVGRASATGSAPAERSPSASPCSSPRRWPAGWLRDRRLGGGPVRAGLRGRGDDARLDGAARSGVPRPRPASTGGRDVGDGRRDRVVLRAGVGRVVDAGVVAADLLHQRARRRRRRWCCSPGSRRHRAVDVPFDWVGQVHRSGGDGRLHLRGDRGRRRRAPAPHVVARVRRRRRRARGVRRWRRLEWRTRWCRSGCSGRGTSRSSVAVGFAFVVGYYGLPFVMSLYLQQLRGLSSFAAGLVFLPMMLVGAVPDPVQRPDRRTVRCPHRDHRRAGPDGRRPGRPRPSSPASVAASGRSPR